MSNHLRLSQIEILTSQVGRVQFNLVDLGKRFQMMFFSMRSALTRPRAELNEKLVVGNVPEH